MPITNARELDAKLRRLAQWSVVDRRVNCERTNVIVDADGHHIATVDRDRDAVLVAMLPQVLSSLRECQSRLRKLVDGDSYVLLDATACERAEELLDQVQSL